MICFDSYGTSPYHYALMSGGLSEFLELSRVTRQPLEQAGRVRLGSLPRLRTLLSSEDGDVHVDLQAQDDGSGRIVLQGEIRARLILTCQRCLQPMQQEIDTSFRLVWVRNETEAAQLQTEASDPLVSPDGRVKVDELVEDELLLALPMAALHQPEQCKAGQSVVAEHSPEPENPAQENPFAVLEHLKQRR